MSSLPAAATLLADVGSCERALRQKRHHLAGKRHAGAEAPREARRRQVGQNLVGLAQQLREYRFDVEDTNTQLMQAEAAVESALKLAPNSPRLATLKLIASGKFAEALPALESALKLAPDNVQLLALRRQTMRKLEVAEPLCREALEGKRAMLGDRHPDTILSINRMAELLQAQGKLEAAEPLIREACASE